MLLSCPTCQVVVSNAGSSRHLCMGLFSTFWQYASAEAGCHRWLQSCLQSKKAGIAPGLLVSLLKGLLRVGALRRRGRPRLDQGVVVDRFALRLLVGKLALRRDVAVLFRLLVPVLGGFLLVQLRSAG